MATHANTTVNAVPQDGRPANNFPEHKLPFVSRNEIEGGIDLWGVPPRPDYDDAWHEGEYRAIVLLNAIADNRYRGPDVLRRVALVTCAPDWTLPATRALFSAFGTRCCSSSCRVSIPIMSRGWLPRLLPSVARRWRPIRLRRSRPGPSIGLSPSGLPPPEGRRPERRCSHDDGHQHDTSPGGCQARARTIIREAVPRRNRMESLGEAYNQRMVDGRH